MWEQWGDGVAPLDQDNAALVEHLGEPEVEGLAHLVEAVDVQVMDRQPPLIHMHEGERRAGDAPDHAQPATKPLHEGGLPCAQVAGEDDHVAGAGQCGQGRSQIPSLLDGRCDRYDGHAATLRGQGSALDTGT